MFTDFQGTGYTNLTDAIEVAVAAVEAAETTYSLFANVKQGTPVPNGLQMPADFLSDGEIKALIGQTTDTPGYYTNVFNFHNPITGANQTVVGNNRLREELVRAWGDYLVWAQPRSLTDYAGYRYTWNNNSTAYSEVEAAINAQIQTLITASDSDYVELLESVVFGSLSESDTDLVEWNGYREDLRAVSEQADFPESYVWPAEPSGI